MIKATVLKEILSQVGLDLTSLHKAKNTWFDKFGQNVHRYIQYYLLKPSYFTKKKCDLVKIWKPSLFLKNIVWIRTWKV